MKKKTVLRLLQSSNYDDVILGLNYMKDYTWEEIKEIGEYSPEYSRVVITTNVGGSVLKDNYILNNDIYCHFNSSLFIYKDTSTTRHYYILL